ncbi:MAG: lipid-A-disaccharide synthase, partial [Alphaproteobacteria bacterium]|nr:lipid-A-disaccharide synthase [Alphaproteobacteria bacterium]
EGLACTFVGHPVLESGAGAGDGKRFRARHDIPTDAPVLCVLPGSRRSEVRALLAPMGVAVRRVARDVAGLRVVVPTLRAVADDVRTATAAWPGVLVVEGENEKYDAFAAADAALAASGTVSLELAMTGLPHAIAYKVNPITAWIARRLIRVRFVNLVNLVLERAVVPEFLRDKDARKTQTDAFAEALRHLGQGRGSPSAHAAEVVLAAIAEYSRTP